MQLSVLASILGSSLKEAMQKASAAQGEHRATLLRRPSGKLKVKRPYEYRATNPVAIKKGSARKTLYAQKRKPETPRLPPVFSLFLRANSKCDVIAQAWQISGSGGGLHK
jgi:hypothetical protein